MVKVILQLYPVLPAADEAERIALRPIGRNVERYHETILGCDDIVRAADELGLWGVGTIEHHFHSEGYEVGPNPGVLNARWAAITKNIHVGALGYTMGAQHPIRVAEETAILDHLAEGRFFTGVSRGYQDRWTNIVGQHIGARATHSDQSSDDNTNWRIFEEHMDILIKAWTEPSIDHNSEHWKIPYPYKEGIDWWMSEATARLGAPGEIGDDGKIHRISVVPAPYQQPHPPVFVASSGSQGTVEYCARKGFIPVYFSNVEKAEQHGTLYLDAARAAGHDFVRGQNQCTVRWIQIADTHEQAVDNLAAHDTEIQKNFYNLSPGGSWRHEQTLSLDTDLKAFADRLEHSEQHAVGTADEVRDMLVRQWKLLPAEYIVLICHYAQQPKESVIDNLERFMQDIKPALDELTPYAPDTVAVAN